MYNCFSDIKAVLFDCDGTLVDSEYAHYLGWRHAVQQLGGDLSLEEYYSYVGNSVEKNAQLLAKKIGSDEPERIFTIKTGYYKELCKAGLPPIASTVEFLKRLAAEKESLGLKIGICSAALKEDVLMQLRHLEIDHLFDIILAGTDDLKEYVDPEGVNKPKPYIYLHAMKLLGVLPEQTVVIEDSPPGAAAGIAAGCFTIAVPNDYTRHHHFGQIHCRLDSFDSMDVSSFLQLTKTVLVDGAVPPNG